MDPQSTRNQTGTDELDMGRYPVRPALLPFLIIPFMDMFKTIRSHNTIIDSFAKYTN